MCFFISSSYNVHNHVEVGDEVTFRKAALGWCVGRGDSHRLEAITAVAAGVHA
jgi:hypothetical protein